MWGFSPSPSKSHHLAYLGQTINILDPLGVPFFAEEKVPLIQTVLGKAQVRTSPEQNKGASWPSARADGLNRPGIFLGFPPGYFALQILSAQVSTLNAWLGGMSWLLHHGPARKLGARGIRDGHQQPQTGIHTFIMLTKRLSFFPLGSE